MSRVRHRRWILAGTLLVAAACSNSQSPTPPTATTLTASVSDVAGDTVVFPVLRNGVQVTPVVPVPSDLIGATVEVSNGNLTATITFAPGTLSRSDTFACLELDVDENPSTGAPAAGGDVPLGFDYSVCGVVPRGSTTVQVSRLGGGVATGVGSAQVVFPAADQMRITVPLALLGNDDGRMAFKVDSMQWVDQPVLNTSALDWMPDIGRAAGLVR
jgi:hypothetical protein